MSRHARQYASRKARGKRAGGGTAYRKARAEALDHAGHRCTWVDGAGRCPKTTGLEGHHRNGDAKDDRFENIAILCHEHHRLVEWRKRRADGTAPHLGAESGPQMGQRPQEGRVFLGGAHPAPRQSPFSPLAEKARKTAVRGYGRRHKALRLKFAPKVASGMVSCARCGELIGSDEPWDLGHDDLDRSRYSGPEHVRCNRATMRPKSRRQAREW
ncbi:MAG: hypothetical protein M3355_12020 [Actinomycetota bacterium]|nr:hypothetical protein [Actinomycetota bacterium]